MIDGLAPSDLDWLRAFFASPNGVAWSDIESGTVPPEIRNQIRPWLDLVRGTRGNTPVILPFVRNGAITGWYATTAGAEGGLELGAEIEAWLGPSYLSMIERVPENANDAMAKALRMRSHGMVYRFTGPDPRTLARIADRISVYAALLGRRPPLVGHAVRPVGSIRADFERALLVQDEIRAEALISELKDTGRLNEENLRFLEVRLSAGLGLWPQIARNHWLVRTMSDLALPPQILADIIEALYRTYVDEIEEAGDAAATLRTFGEHIAGRYPRLFATRRGIRTTRVIKAFLLFEQLQVSPSPQILASLIALLPDGDAARLVVPRISRPPVAIDPAQVMQSQVVEAEGAFDDAQYDRALAFFLDLPLTRKSIGRLLSCVTMIGTGEARLKFLAAIDAAPADLLADLPAHMLAKIDALRALSPTDSDKAEPRPAPMAASGWLAWAEQLRSERDLAGAAAAVQNATTQWDVAPFKVSDHLSKQLAAILGNLGGDAAALARQAAPQIFASFFPPNETPLPVTRPIAELLFLLIAMDEPLARSDLDLLAQLLSLLLELGLSNDAYIGLIGDLDDVQGRIGSYTTLPWSLDISETLATAPCPSDAARDARLRLFIRLIGQIQSYAHRLGPQDLLPLEFLAKDYGVGDEAIAALRRDKEEEKAAFSLPHLAGKTIGIYTLAEAAGARAQVALEQMFPGCKVVVNSDLVCTAQLSNLAKGADVFVFAWKSSSHQAFYCVKDAMVDGEPIWAPGKGTASILRAVLGHMA